MNHEYDTLSEQYIPLAGSYHSRGMWYFRLYELNPLSFVCFVCLSISGPGVVRIWIFGIPYLSEFIPRLSVIGRRRIIRIRNYIRREAGMRAIISSQHPTSLIWQSDCTHSNDAASPSAGKPDKPRTSLLLFYTCAIGPVPGHPAVSRRRHLPGEPTGCILITALQSRAVCSWWVIMMRVLP